ncbi:acyltransferase family protein [Anaerostipes sp. MSJ-23]|uniref:acyltransferase family protein n=1 Tax=Anaerostipes sp. MSJ-23 TaxID=2841520 RepID=UPI001C0FF73F|nr:acyltransferase [Anaerostipes sp. MSJ-23]
MNNSGKSIFSLKNIFKLFIFNESPVGGHLWYLGALLYVLLIVFVIDKLNCRRVLYWIIPVFLVLDLIFGKYAIVIFNREFPYILVRNFLCVGIPYFCLGTLIREKKIRKNISKRVLEFMIMIFALTGICERFILVNYRMNATRDHYISTTFLAIAVFLYVLKSNWKNERLSKIGREYSTWLYIIHPIFITVFAFITKKIGIYSLYSYVGPIVIYIVSLLFLILLKKIKLERYI